MLSILICSITERSKQLAELMHLFSKEVGEMAVMEGKKENDLIAYRYKPESEIFNDVEFIVAIDNKKISIGDKRQELLNLAAKDWIVFFDDDDIPSPNYVNLILNAIYESSTADCIGIRGTMTTNGENPKTWCHRFGLPIKGDGITPASNEYDYLRPIIHFNPVRREKALQAGFRNMSFGEDMDYAKRLNPLLEEEIFINENLFHYNYSNKIDHKTKYGIK